MISLKKNIIESKLGLGISLKRKETILNKISFCFREKCPGFSNEEVITRIKRFDEITDYEKKLAEGSEITANILTFLKNDLSLKLDGDVSSLIGELKQIDEKIKEFQNKYQMSLMAYDLAKEKSIFSALLKKSKNI